jgi:hypothetical protein
MKEFTPKQIAKYRRQKYLSALNKCTTNLYKMFKNSATSYENYKSKFTTLKKEIEKFNDVIISAEHIKRTKEYIDNLYLQTVTHTIDEEAFKKLSEEEIPKLNRLQKMKKKTKYTKEKYKSF